MEGKKRKHILVKNSELHHLYEEYEQTLKPGLSPQEKNQADMAFIQKHPDSFLSAFILKFYQRRNPSRDSLALRLYNQLSKRIRQTKTGAGIKKQIAIHARLQPGKVLPDFESVDTAGIARKLSSLRGHYVLVDFWASWCGPCRQENPVVVEAYKKYRGKGFEIIGVSLDDDKASWIAAIKADDLSWLHVSDLKGWKSDLAKEYNIRSIPDNFLLDKNGKILARGLRGKDLEEKLADLF